MQYIENKTYDELKKGSGKQPVATTMAFVRLLKEMMKDKEIGARFVPIIPDEARTFGMDSLFPTAKIYSPHGQTYEAVDRNLLLSYKESEKGQILHEGITEDGAMGSMILAVMTRVSLGHTGRLLVLPRGAVGSYALVHAGALARVGDALVPAPAQGTLLVVSALLWASAFGLFAVLYRPILTRPRVDGKEG